MPPREWRLRIEDILDAAGRVARYVEGKDLAAFNSDDLTLDAVSRCFGIIGEAVKHVPKEVIAVRQVAFMCDRAQSAKPVNPPGTRALAAAMCRSWSGPK